MKFNIRDKIKWGQSYTIADVSAGSWFFDTPTVYLLIAQDGTEWVCDEKMLNDAVKIN